MEVAGSVTCIILLILFCGSAAGNRKVLYSFKAQENGMAMAPSSDNGICKSMVETHGYDCEEHTVSPQGISTVFLSLIKKITLGFCIGNYTRWLHSEYAKNPRGSVRWDTRKQTTSPITARALNG